jgi:FkbM family methyltransferase
MRAPTVRDCAQAAGRVLTRILLNQRWRQVHAMRRTYVSMYLLGKRLSEARELATMKRLLTPGMVVADVGANVGFYTFEMAAAVGPTGRILAFEPDPLNVGMLQSRQRRSAVQNVEVYGVALGERPGRSTLYSSAYNRADNRLHPTHQEPHVEASEVEVQTLDDVLSQRDRGSIDAMKIDVQGAEEQVLRGARNTLGRGLRWIWIEFSPTHLRGAGTQPRALLSYLQDLDMSVFEVDEEGYLEPLDDLQDYVRRIGTGYGDLVLLSAACARQVGGLI